jgi:thioredoxin-like negative regulator of GroEL
MGSSTAGVALTGIPVDPASAGPQPKPSTSAPEGGAVDVAPASAAPANVAPASVDRRERMAADYVATGQFEQAAQLYDRLAIDHPENPAFREAARILRTKLDAGMR